MSWNRKYSGGSSDRFSSGKEDRVVRYHAVYSISIVFDQPGLLKNPDYLFINSGQLGAILSPDAISWDPSEPVSGSVSESPRIIVILANARKFNRPLSSFWQGFSGFMGKHTCENCLRWKAIKRVLCALHKGVIFICFLQNGASNEGEINTNPGFFPGADKNEIPDCKTGKTTE